MMEIRKQIKDLKRVEIGFGKKAYEEIVRKVGGVGRLSEDRLRKWIVEKVKEKVDSDTWYESAVDWQINNKVRDCMELLRERKVPDRLVFLVWK